MAMDAFPCVALPLYRTRVSALGGAQGALGCPVCSVALSFPGF